MKYCGTNTYLHQWQKNEFVNHIAYVTPYKCYEKWFNIIYLTIQYLNYWSTKLTYQNLDVFLQSLFENHFQTEKTSWQVEKEWQKVKALHSKSINLLNNHASVDVHPHKHEWRVFPKHVMINLFLSLHTFHLGNVPSLVF